jgi:nicotinate (nicotinamide) nucleotide adenylyltransferase
MKKIGLLLGSFDPIHVAHVNMAACAINSGLCDKVLFVVAKHNPWKDNAPAPFDLRCDMILKSIGGFGLDDVCVCDYEKDIESPTYTYKVLEKIREKYPEDELFILCGTDTVEKIPNWKRFETDIKDKVGIIEFKRNDGTEIDNNKVPFIVREGSRPSLTNKGYWYIKTQRMDVSSTLVRSMIAKGMNPTPYVSEGTLDIINKYNLYR